jgi:hypothetical protein
MTRATPPSSALSRAHGRLHDALSRAAPTWFAGSWSGTDREDGRPVILVYAAPGGIEAGLRWAAGIGGESGGVRVVVTHQVEGG